MPSPSPYQPRNHIRIVTAASLFDGHDAAINIMRRILQASGAEVIHLGHNRSVLEIVTAAIQEDAQAIGVSCYQGGHVEFFKYLVNLLAENGAPHIKVFGGGGGVIVPEEIQELESYGICKIYSPDDGRKMGLQGMINHFLEQCDFSTTEGNEDGDIAQLTTGSWKLVARAITAVEVAKESGNGNLPSIKSALLTKIGDRKVPILGITGTGGAGKSSLTDEIVLRFLNDQKDKTVGIISVDPTRRKTGGALLGDRIRMNCIYNDRVYYRSLATRNVGMEIPGHMEEAIDVLKAAGFDLIIAETAGIGQGDAAIVPLSDVSLYVMTSEFGAQSQLEKIDMLDFADLVAVNKYDRQGSEDAIHDVRKQMQRNKAEFGASLEDFPVYGTIASRFNDDGVTSLYVGIIDAIRRRTGLNWCTELKARPDKKSSSKTIIIPPERTRYLSEIAGVVRRYHAWGEEQETLVRRLWQLDAAARALREEGLDQSSEALQAIKHLQEVIEKKLDPRALRLVGEWEDIREAYSGEEYVFKVRGKEIRIPLRHRTLSGTSLPRTVLPKFQDRGQLLRWRLKENLPGMFPYTAGVYPFKRQDEEPTRMFAGEGDPFRTNRRFKYLSENYTAKRLSTAFDSVTLYGKDPEERPDIYGKVGTSGVSVCTLEDVKALYSGFDLASPNTSVSMTINGPAPMMLAMFFNTAIDQQIDKFKEENGTEPPPDQVLRIRSEVLQNVRGTVQADILKEDQGQNTCIFSTDFSLKMMGDIQEYFIQNQVRNFYSVSISGYHIAEAGANPITQLALTLANGFTYVEYYLSRGMHIDDFAPNLSFFFSNGLEPEYSVIGRVARRIWAIAVRENYGGNERSQMLKYHIQTSGRSLHAQDIQFNDIRTTLQALIAIYDNCNSLHTNSYDEAITTPTEESVRRALAIQLIINKEWGLSKVDNINQGSFIIEELTDLVEEAVLQEFDRISQRGGVLGAMETGYQRTKIQDESLYYENLKSTGEYPIIGVNTFINPYADYSHQLKIELARATEEEKQSQLSRLSEFQERNQERAGLTLERLQRVAQSGGNIFEELMETVKYCSLGQISQCLFQAGGQYRRNM
ncbi:MAG: methylmalonyl-CoA mutase family protein [Desulfomonile tiedjei]|uniref:Fused isobutyryl-CoA mutase n=1 Tax=Desulfomonile tiedjei TaxID=2358 RepID=A0A9D6V3R5_9BACT|nr:methylmalonyl-CoA mutase family protein [Desulfomonile tiedjei]